MTSAHDPGDDTTARPPSDWTRLGRIFEAVLDAPPTQREQVLHELADGHVALMTEVRGLVAAAERTDAAFDRPLLDQLPATLGEAMAAPRSLVGRTLGPYRVVAEIGRGGMGVVYEGVHIDDEFEKRVAIKSLAVGLDRPELLWRFKRERRILAGLSHPNIAALFDGGTTDDGVPYLVMEFVEGQPIDAWCDARQLTIAQRLDLFRQVCAAIHFAHGKLVVHRDLKPGNILVTDDGVVKVLDFGIAKLLSPDGVAGVDDTRDRLAPLTTAYASPEQLRGEEITTSTDVYSLGVVLYRLLTGIAPYEFSTSSLADALSAHATQPTRAPSDVATDRHAQRCRVDGARRLRAQLAGELDAIVLMTLRAEQERRYADVAALSEDLRRSLQGRPVHARPDTLSYRVGKFVQRERALVAGVTIAFAALLTGAVWSASSAARAREEARRATRMVEYLRAIVGAADPSHYSTLRSGSSDVTLAEVLDSTRARVPRDLADEPRIRADLYWTLGSAYRVFNRNDVAAMLLDSARILHERTVGPQSIEVARDVHYAALIHQETGRPDLAVAGMREALARYRRLPAPPDSEVIDVLASLGTALGVGMQQTEEADTLLREAERRELRAEMPRWALLGLVQSSLGATLSQRADARASDSAFERSLRSYERDSSRSKGDLAFTQLNWGTSLGRRGFGARAVELKREGLRNLESVYGSEHYLTAIFRQRLAEELVNVGALPEAQQVVDSAIAVQERLTPTNHRELGMALRLRGGIETRTGRLDAAERTLRRARQMLDSMGTARSLPEIGVRSELSRLAEARGGIVEARRELDEALRIASDALGASNVITLTMLGRLAAFELRAGDTTRAAALRADSAARVSPGSR